MLTISKPRSAGQAQNQKETHRKRAELLVATRRHRRGMARTTGATVRTWRFHSGPAALLRPPFCPFTRVALFFLAAALVKEKTGRHRQNGKNMKLEEVNLKTKEAVDFLVQSLESGQSAVLTQYLGAMAKFRNYSFGNIMLITRQKPDATHVAGYRTWTTLGRFVRRGEKGIFILAPMVGNKRKKDETDNAEQTADAKETQSTLYGFRGVYVFDITQTEGKELPALTEVQGDVSGYRERLFKFVEAQSVEISFSERIAPAKG